MTTVIKTVIDGSIDGAVDVLAAFFFSLSFPPSASQRTNVLPGTYPYWYVRVLSHQKRIIEKKASPGYLASRASSSHQSPLVLKNIEKPKTKNNKKGTTRREI